MASNDYTSDDFAAGGFGGARTDVDRWRDRTRAPTRNRPEAARFAVDWRDEERSYEGDRAGSRYMRRGHGSTFDVEGAGAPRVAALKAAAYRGLGPRGYRRSDARIREEVCELLTDDPHIDASDLEVNVQTGEVTLSGAVGSRADKRRAEDLAEIVSGVTDVHNRLRVTVRDADVADKGASSSPMAPQDLTA